MTTAILAAGKRLNPILASHLLDNPGPLPGRHPWRQVAGVVVFLSGTAAMLDNSASVLWRWITSG